MGGGGATIFNGDPFRQSTPRAPSSSSSSSFVFPWLVIFLGVGWGGVGGGGLFCFFFVLFCIFFSFLCRWRPHVAAIVATPSIRSSMNNEESSF